MGMPEASGQYRVPAANRVKFDPKVSALLALRHTVGRRACVAVATALAGLPAGARAQPAEPPLLLGGPVQREARRIETDPRLPVGPRFTAAPRPASAGRACSDRLPVCVHATAGAADVATVLGALDALETAYERLVLALRLPEPLADLGQGGTDALDLYLLPPDTRSPAYERVHVASSGAQAAASPAGFDRSAAFCTAMADGPALLARASTLCVAEAIALRLDPAETPHARRGFATALWWTVGAPTSADFEAIHAVQSAPYRALATDELGATSEGSAVLFSYLEQKLGAGDPGTLATGLFSASAQRLESGATTWQNEPDTFDVLRHTLEESKPRVASLLGDLAAARGFVGSRDDGAHLVDLAWSGSFGAPSFDWVLPFASLPRRVRLTPVEPTGAALVWVDLTGAPPGAPLGFQAEWEPPAQFQWVLVRVGADGRELGRLEVPFQQKETKVEARLVDIGDAKGILIAGAHLEEVDGDHPFDPDVAPFETHGAMVYVVEL
jgi:hypothetical protein